MRNKLREFRQARGLSLDAMAKVFKICKMAYWKIENNQSDGSFISWMTFKKQYELSDRTILIMYNENSKAKKGQENDETEQL